MAQKGPHKKGFEMIGRVEQIKKNWELIVFGVKGIFRALFGKQ